MTSAVIRGIDELREEFAANGVSGWLWSWLKDVLASYVALRLKPRYSAALYSPSGQWDEDGMHDLVHGFMIERAFEKAALLAALQRAENTAGAITYLERALHNYACSERVRTVAGNIYARLGEVLASDGRLRPMTGLGRRSAYGLDEWIDDPPAPVNGEDVPDAMRFFPTDLQWREYATGDRQPPGLFNEDLSRIAFDVIRGTEQLWTAGQIMQLIRRWFELESEGKAAESSLDTAAALSSAEPSPLDAVVAEDLARRAIEFLNADQRRVLKAVIGSGGELGVRELAAKLAMSKTMVNRHQHFIIETFRRLHVTSPGEQNQVVSAAGKLLGS